MQGARQKSGRCEKENARYEIDNVTWEIYARKYAGIFVRGHYLFREANSFPRAKLEENCDLRGTDNVQGQIFKVK